MAYYEDLSPYEYGEIEPGRVLLNVGWLERGHAFPTGPVDERFLDALTRCLLRPTRLYRGLHACDLCDEWNRDGFYVSAFGRRIVVGNGEVSVTHMGVEYAAPTLLVHYIIAHGYQPPRAFVDAVFARAACIVPLTSAEQDEIRAMDLAELRRRARATALRLLQRDELAWAAQWLDAKTPPPDRESPPIIELLGAVRSLENARLANDPRYEGFLREQFVEVLELAREIEGISSRGND